MLYMMMDARGKDTLIKVGQTKDLNKRMSKYRTHNPLAKLVSTLEIPGEYDKFIEKEWEADCHSSFEEWGYIRLGNTEWFYIPKGKKKEYREKGFNVLIKNIFGFNIKIYNDTNITGGKNKIYKMRGAS